MKASFWFLTLTPLLALLSYAVLLFMVLRRTARSRLYGFFALYLMAMAIWSFGSAMMRLNPDRILLWNKVLIAGATVMPYAYFSFVQTFLAKKQGRWLWVGVVSVLGLEIANALGLMVTDARLLEGGLLSFDTGPATYLAAIYGALFWGFSVWRLTSAYHRTSNPVGRNRLRYPLLGLLLVVLGTTTNTMPALGAFPLDHAANLVNALLLAYAILRHQLLDITLVVRRGLLYSIPTTIIGAGYFLVVFLAVNLLHIVTGHHILLLALVMAAVAAVAVQPLRDKAQSWIDRLFFREKYDSRLMLQKLSRTAASVLELDRLTGMILDEVTTTIHIERAAFFLKQEKSGEFRLMAHGGLDQAGDSRLRNDHPVVHWLSRHERILTKHDIDVMPQFRALWKREIEDLDRIGAELLIPLKAKGELVGVFAVGPKLSGETYSQDDQLTLAALADQTAIAIENARLYAVAQQELTERKRVEKEREHLLVAEREQRLLAETLTEVSLALTSQVSPEAVLDEILEQAERIIPYGTAHIMLLEDDTLRIACWRGYQAPGSEELISKLVQSLADLPLDAEAIKVRKPLVIHNTHQEPGWKVFPETAWVRSHLSVPICLRDRVLGLLRLDSDTPGALSSEDAERLQPLANAAAIALENARLFADTRRQAEQLEALRHVSQDLTALRDRDTLLRQIAERAIRLLDVDAGGMYLYRPEREVLEWVVQVGGRPDRLGITLQRGEGLSGQVWATGEPMFVDDYGTWSGKSPKWSDTPARATMSVPIQWGDEFLGVLNVWSGSRERHFTSEDAALLSQFSVQAAIAIQNVRLYAKAERRTVELSTMLEAARAVSSTLELEKVLTLIAQQMVTAIGVSGCTLSRLDHEASAVVTWIEWRKPGRGRPGKPGAIYDLEDFPATQAVLESRQPVTILATDPEADPAEVALMRQQRYVSLLMLPLVAGEEVIGLVELDDDDNEREFTDAEIHLCQALTDQAAIAIRNARLFEQVQGHADELEQRVAERTRELAEANRRLRELDQLKSRFISDVSHELRTPVTNIKLYLHLLEQSKSEKHQEYMNVITEQTDWLMQLVQDVLDLSRLDLDGERVEFAPVDLNAVVKEVVSTHRPRAEAADLALIFESDTALLPPVRAERNQLAQVVTNLVTNAINYTSEGQVRVSTRMDTERGQACLKVRDTGMGIEPEDMPHLYERFYRGQRVGSSNIPGTGLGLAIVKEIVDLHGGRIEIQSKVDEGTTVRVWLPLEANEGGRERG